MRSCGGVDPRDEDHVKKCYQERHERHRLHAPVSERTPRECPGADCRDADYKHGSSHIIMPAPVVRRVPEAGEEEQSQQRARRPQGVGPVSLRPLWWRRVACFHVCCHLTRGLTGARASGEQDGTPMSSRRPVKTDGSDGSSFPHHVAQGLLSPALPRNHSERLPPLPNPAPALPLISRPNCHCGRCG